MPDLQIKQQKMLHAGKKLFLMFSDIIEQDIRAFLDFLKR